MANTSRAGTQVSTADPCKESFLEVPEDQGKIMRSKRVTARSVYVGDRDAFMTFIGESYPSIQGQLKKQEQSKRL